MLFESTRVNATIHDVVRMCSHTFPKDIMFTTTLDPDDPEILADPNQLHQALLNLCINARDAMPHGGRLTLGTRKVKKEEVSKRAGHAFYDEYVCLSIADDGTGMDEATLARIFEPFFTTKAPGKGTGLGLAMVYGVVNSHHALIDVQSTVGVGTTFSLLFPTHPAGVRALDFHEPTEIEPEGGNETILLVEDEETIGELAQSLLEDHGYRVFMARDGAEAVEVFRHHAATIDLVVTDLGLPRLSGLEAFMRMRETRPDIGAVVITGYIDAESRSELLKGGVKHLLQKPYRPNQLLRKIREGLDT
jgi:CheY-like chemotaxis protein